MSGKVTAPLSPCDNPILYNGKMKFSRNSTQLSLGAGGQKSEPASSATESPEVHEIPEDIQARIIASLLPKEEAIQLADLLISRGREDELILFCEKHLATYPYHAHFWSLLGVAHGNKGYFDNARRSFTQALLINPGNAQTLANYITACFQGGDAVTAFFGIERYYNGLDDPGRHLVLRTLYNAWQKRLFTKEETTKPVWDLLVRSKIIRPGH